MLSYPFFSPSVKMARHERDIIDLAIIQQMIRKYLYRHLKMSYSENDR